MRADILVAHPYKHHALNLAAGCARSGLSTAFALPFYRRGLGRLVALVPGQIGRKAQGYFHPGLGATRLIQSPGWQLRKLATLLGDPGRIAEPYDTHVANQLLRRKWRPDIVVTLQDYMPRTSAAAKQVGAMLWSDQILNLSAEASARIARHAARYGAGVIPPHSEAANTRVLAMADVVTAPSAFTLQGIQDRIASHTRVHVVPYGVDTVRFGAPRVPATDAFTIVARAQSVRKGGHLVLLAILRSHATWARLVHPRKLRVVFLGACEPALADLLAQAKRLKSIAVQDGNIANHDVPALLATAGLFLMPTLSEGMSFACVEAMCAGVPILTTGYAGVDCFVDGEMGALIEDSVESVEAGVSGALGDQSSSERWSRNARSAAATLTWDHYERAIASISSTVGRSAPVTTGH